MSKAITCFYKISKDIQDDINKGLRIDEFIIEKFSYTKYYNNGIYEVIDIDNKKFYRVIL